MSDSYWDEKEIERRWTNRIFKWVLVPLCAIVCINCMFVCGMLFIVMTKNMWQSFIKVMFGG